MTDTHVVSLHTYTSSILPSPHHIVPFDDACYRKRGRAPPQQIALVERTPRPAPWEGGQGSGEEFGATESRKARPRCHSGGGEEEVKEAEAEAEDGDGCEEEDEGGEENRPEE